MRWPKWLTGQPQERPGSATVDRDLQSLLSKIDLLLERLDQFDAQLQTLAGQSRKETGDDG
jgi:hypothetical protein